MIRCMRAAFWFGEHAKKFLKMIEHENRVGLTQIQMVSVAPAQFDCVATSEDNEVVKNSVGRRTCWEKFENERSCNLRFGSCVGGYSNRAYKVADMWYDSTFADKLDI